MWHAVPVRPGSGRTEEYSRCQSLGTKPRRPDNAANFATSGTLSNGPTERFVTSANALQRHLHQADAGEPALAELHDLAVDLRARQVQQIAGNRLAVDPHPTLSNQPARC